MNNAIGMDLSAFPKELVLLLHILSNPQPISSLGETDYEPDDFNWVLFLELARFHRVYPVLYAQLKNSDAPPAVIQSLKSEFKINTFQMLHLTRTADHLFRLLKEHHIRSLLLKGPALAKDLYGDTSLRTCKDLDILIPVEDFDRTEQLLHSCGFIAEEGSPRLSTWRKGLHHCSYTNHEERIQIEVHWRLHPGSWPEPTFDELWSRKQESFLPSHPVYRPGNEDLFLYLATHGARHGWFRLRWLLDIRHLLDQKLDFGLITHYIKQSKSHIIVGQTLILCNRLLGTPFIADMQSFYTSPSSQLAAQTAIGYIVQMSTPNVHALSHSRYLLSLLKMRQKLSYLKSFYYPSSQDALTLPLPSLLHFLYFPIRPLLLLWRRLKYKTRVREL